jgi:hypothetical protein
MSKEYVTRRTVLNALRNEPLNNMGWVHNPRDPSCSVCAVGAVLRRAGFENGKISSFGLGLFRNGAVTPAQLPLYSNIEGVIKKYLEEGRFLHALSMKYEFQAKRTGSGKRTRGVLARFVKANFPTKIELNTKL